MELEKSKPLSLFIFTPLAFLVFIRPFISGLAYPAFELWYEISIIFLVIMIFSAHGVYPERSRGVRLKNIVRVIRPGGESRTNPYILPISLLLLSYAISTITSVNIPNSLKESLKFLSYISVFFAVSQTDSDQKKILIKAIIAAALIISVYSIYQYIWGYQYTIDYLKKTNTAFLLESSYARDILLSKRAIGTFPSPNILAGYLAMAFFLSLYIFFSGRNALKIFPAVIILIALIFTKSLGAWLILIAAVVVLFFISYDDFKNKKLLFAVYFILIAFTIAFIIVNRWERLTNLENPHNSITQRLNYWRTSIAVIKDHPFLGVGPGNFQEVFLKYKVGLSTDTRYAHNILMHMWAENGALGFAGMLLLIAAFIYKSIIKSKYLFLAGLAFILHNLIDITYFIPETGLFWWVILGLLLIKKEAQAE
ncbi:MAG: O-antigen ligase family protein [Candidatus Omnitrophica bacterium]|nr:O-antigen ligase family protein [Candidatus Omnitrophota bacterium]